MPLFHTYFFVYSFCLAFLLAEWLYCLLSKARATLICYMDNLLHGSHHWCMRATQKLSPSCHRCDPDIYGVFLQTLLGVKKEHYLHFISGRLRHRNWGPDPIKYVGGIWVPKSKTKILKNMVWVPELYRHFKIFLAHFNQWIFNA